MEMEDGREDVLLPWNCADKGSRDNRRELSTLCDHHQPTPTAFALANSETLGLLSLLAQRTR